MKGKDKGKGKGKERKGRGKERGKDLPDQCQTASYVPGASVICVLKYLLTYLLSLHGDPRSMFCNASCLQLFYASVLDACVCVSSVC